MSYKNVIQTIQKKFPESIVKESENNGLREITLAQNEFFETTTSLKQAVRRFFCYIAGVKEHVISWLGNLQKLYTAGAEI